jgi:hypothetical protein
MIWRGAGLLAELGAGREPEEVGGEEVGLGCFTGVEKAD